MPEPFHTCEKQSDSGQFEFFQESLIQPVLLVKFLMLPRAKIKYGGF